MKPLLTQKITRRRKKIGDYIDAETQATLDGLMEFAQRQEERRRLAQEPSKPAPLPENVKPIILKRQA